MPAGDQSPECDAGRSPAQHWRVRAPLAPFPEGAAALRPARTALPRAGWRGRWLSHVPRKPARNGPAHRDAAAGRYAGVVATYWDEVERRHANMREVVRHLQLNLAGKDADYAMYEINQRDVPEQLVLTEQRHITAPELPAWIGEATMRLIDTAYSFTGGDQNGPMFVIYHGEV